jgi:hypothetical protein
MTSQEREKLSTELEQEIGELLRKKNVLLDGYMLREVESIASKLAFDAVEKKHKDLLVTR